MASRGKSNRDVRLNVRSSDSTAGESDCRDRYEQALDKVSPGAAARPAAPYRKDLALADLKPGECGTVMRLNGNFCGRLRLLEMGLLPGTPVRMVRAAAFGGPVDIEVRGYQLSLRREEATAVWLGDEDQP